MRAAQSSDLLEPSRLVTHGGRNFVRSTVPDGENCGQPFILARPLAGRYEPLRFHSASGRSLLVHGRDARTGAAILIKGILRYDVEAQARTQDREGFTAQLRVHRKGLEAERRLLVAYRNAGCSAVPLPLDFVFDINPQLEGPYPTEDLEEWHFDDGELLASEPYLILRITGCSLEAALRQSAERRLPEARALRILYHLAGVLEQLHRPLSIRAGMTWQVILQDLRPENVLLGVQDEVGLLRLDACQLVNRETGLRLLAGRAPSGYCAPECGQAQATLSPATDVYGAGLVLFQTLTGRDPRGLSAASASSTQARAERPDFRLLDGRCRPATRELLERCLNADPTRRYADGEALQRALEPLLRAP